MSIPPKPWEIFKLLVSRPRTAVSVVKFGATGMTPTAAAVRRGDMAVGMRIFGRAVLGPETYRRLSEARLEQVRANSIRAEFTGSGLAPLNERQVRSIQMPTLLVTGQRSPRLFHRLTDRLQELLPHSRRIEIGEASHNIHEGNASAYNAAVLAYLKQHEQRNPAMRIGS